MRDARLTSLRNGVLTALGLLQACGGQVDGGGLEPDDAAAALTPGAGAPAEDEAPGTRCDAMLASNASANTCWPTPRYAWDGARCQALYCSCVGADCEGVFGSAMACYEARVGCDPLAAERAACIERYPGGSGAAGAQAASECVSNAGTACDAASFISEAAAVCIAELEGLEEGLEPWRVVLNHGSGHEGATWSVTNTMSGPDEGGAGGRSLTLDATTGLVLADLGWQLIPGRPFLVERAPRTAEVARRADYSASTSVRLDGIAAERRAALAAEWTRIGLMEHASVAAFARFALQLLGLGAPPDLLEACQQAMADELRHARIAFGLASAYAGAPLGPGSLKLDGALDESSGDLLADVVMATLVEGCIGETIASLDAREGAAHAVDAHVQRALSEIAADEERHAELAWRFLDWALAQRPALAPQLLTRARAQLARTPARPDSERGRAMPEPALLEHGILSFEQKLELEAQALEHVIVPCLVALASKHAAASPWGASAYLA
jgi:hypothetical protein